MISEVKITRQDNITVIRKVNPIELHD